MDSNTAKTKMSAVHTLVEYSFGQPIFTSIAATSFSLFRNKTLYYIVATKMIALILGKLRNTLIQLTQVWLLPALSLDQLFPE